MNDISQASAVAPRRNKRSENTIREILAAAEEIILESGVERVSILDVCRVAGISRGTFYRYYSSQDELLEAFSRHKRDRFRIALLEAVERFDDPEERFDAFINYMDSYLQGGNARQLLRVAPEYAMGWFQRIFHDAITRFQDDLRIVFDFWEGKVGGPLDRELISELMIRYILSEQLVPATLVARKALPDRIKRLLRSIRVR